MTVHPAARPVPDGATDAGVTDQDGAGLSVVVNPSAGSAGADDVADRLRAALPRAAVVVAEEGADLGALLEQAATAGVIGIVGGDGSINAAATVALRHDVPLAVFPGGTLNHFARDLGLAELDDTVAALRSASVRVVDVGLIAGQPFLNTASFGAYAELVDRRERHQAHLGKWPAMAYALVRTLVRAAPMQVIVDGTPRALWWIFIGNGTYEPTGLWPARRPRLDDGRFDIRYAEDTGPYSRLRLLVAALTGRLGRTDTFTRVVVESMILESVDGLVRLARDGETGDGPALLAVDKRARGLRTYAR